MSETIITTIIESVQVLLLAVITTIVPLLIMRVNSLGKDVKESKIKTAETHEQVVNDHGGRQNMRDQQDNLDDMMSYLVKAVYWLVNKAQNNSDRIDEIEELTMPVQPMTRKQARLDRHKPNPRFITTDQIPKGKDNGKV